MARNRLDNINTNKVSSVLTITECEQLTIATYYVTLAINDPTGAYNAYDFSIGAICYLTIQKGRDASCARFILTSVESKTLYGIVGIVTVADTSSLGEYDIVIGVQGIIGNVFDGQAVGFLLPEYLNVDPYMSAYLRSLEQHTSYGTGGGGGGVNSPWIPDHFFAKASYCVPLSLNSPYYAISQNAGTSGHTEPLWGFDGNLVQDNEIQWSVYARDHARIADTVIDGGITWDKLRRV